MPKAIAARQIAADSRFGASNFIPTPTSMACSHPIRRYFVEASKQISFHEIDFSSQGNNSEPQSIFKPIGKHDQPAVVGIPCGLEQFVHQYDSEFRRLDARMHDPIA
ncbi:MAG TPA: hypothetical protein VGM11_09625 [Acidobacteriaceae bacterium]